MFFFIVNDCKEGLGFRIKEWRNYLLGKLLGWRLLLGAKFESVNGKRVEKRGRIVNLLIKWWGVYFLLDNGKLIYFIVRFLLLIDFFNG